MIKCGCCKKKFPKGCSGCTTIAYNKINIRISGLPSPFFTGAVDFEQTLEILNNGQLYNPPKTYILTKDSDYQLINPNPDLGSCVYPTGATTPVVLNYLFGSDIKIRFNTGSCLFGSNMSDSNISFEIVFGAAISNSLSCGPREVPFRESIIGYGLSYKTGSTNKGITKAVLTGENFLGVINGCRRYDTSGSSIGSLPYRWNFPENNNNYDNAVFDVPKNANEFLTVTWSFS